MSIEALWLSSYSDGRPPICTRLSRLPLNEQFGAAVDFAIGYARGEAGYMNRSISKTREKYWMCRTFDSENRSVKSAGSIWWMIPARVERRIFQLYAAAEECAVRAKGRASVEVADVLESWRRTGHWRRVIGKLQQKYLDARRKTKEPRTQKRQRTERKPRATKTPTKKNPANNERYHYC